jgi:Uma2 family endonuclease
LKTILTGKRMLTLTREIITPEAYLEMERKSPKKNELLNGEIIPIGGASLPHNIVASNLAILLGSLLWEKDLIVCQSDMRVHNPVTGSYFYPDVVVIQGEPKLADDEFDNLLNPVLIVEVLSEGTESYDRGDKSLIYRQIPSLKEYLILSQKDAFAEHLMKLSENKWQLEEIKGMDKSLHLLDGLCEIKLSAVYNKIKLEK